MHTFKNFKNFADAEIDLSKPMTLLIGRNGSGKSNVIEGVELLAELIKGREVHEISDVTRGGMFEIRGSLNGCFNQGKEEFEVGFKDSDIIKGESFIGSYKVNLKPIIKNEYYDNLDTFDIEILKKEIPELPPTMFLGYSNDFIKMRFRNKFFKKYNQVSVFDIYPRLMRQHSPIGLNQLSRNGSNISSVLYYLKQNNPDILENFLEKIRKFPEEAFETFEFIETSDDSDILFGLKYPNSEKPISAKLLSDGTLRALAILTALETVPEGSRIIIEEIDNGIHPSKADMLINAIWDASNRRNLNTLITTHNPATLDSLNDEQLECVVVCHYDKLSQSAKLTPFFELPRVGVLLQKGKLGSLVTRNVIERYLEPDFEERRKAKVKNWMETVE